jgi:hypothetical protein
VYLKTNLNLQCLKNNKQTRKMKKVLGFLFVASMVVFASCTSATETATEAVEETAAVVDSAATAVVDSAAVVVDSAAAAVK